MVVYECKICNYKTIRKNQYERHLITKKHISNLELYNSQKTNMDEASNTNYVEPHNMFLCSCGKQFSREDNFLRHCKYYCQEKIEKKNIVCQFCGRYYSTNYNLNKHLKKCKKRENNDNISIKDYKELFSSMYK